MSWEDMGKRIGRRDDKGAAMITRYASTFTDALARLKGHEQKLVKAAAFDLQIDPAGHGKSFHRIDRSKDPNFWSVRVNDDIRIIVHKDRDALLLAYVDHHDKAYAWAERRRIEVHPRTGAAQFVELVERTVAAALAAERPAPPRAPEPPPRPFARLSDDQLLDAGVPADWLAPVRETSDGELFDLLDRLPQEAAEALLDFAAGGELRRAAPAAPDADPFAHPDAERRFRTVENLDELKAALEFPWEKWAVFLHPVQRDLVERRWSGPARVAGTAGTGKTIVALHRAAHLARADREARVLLTSFSPPLAGALSRKLDVLAASEPDLRQRITVKPLRQVARDWYAGLFGEPSLASADELREMFAEAARNGLGAGLGTEFLIDEWDKVVDAWQVPDAEAYADVPRLGRKTRLGARQRETAWAVFDYVREALAERKLTTWASLYERLRRQLEAGQSSPFTHAVVDEAQDLSVAEARFLAALGRAHPEALFFAGDLGQRIFQLPFSWRSLALDVRGRSHRLKVNYRTSHQIRAAADRLLPAAITDMDGVEEGRRGTVSVFDGPPPELILAADEEAEAERVAAFVGSCLGSGMKPAEIALLVRSKKQVPRAQAAAERANVNAAELTDGCEPAGEGVALATMHQTKGLEFRAVAVMACDEDALPDAERLASVGDEADLEEAFDTERHLLYVACTRARDRLMVSGVAPGSEFLNDLSALN